MKCLDYCNNNSRLCWISVRLTMQHKINQRHIIDTDSRRNLYSCSHLFSFNFSKHVFKRQTDAESDATAGRRYQHFICDVQSESQSGCLCLDEQTVASGPVSKQLLFATQHVVEIRSQDANYRFLKQ